MSLPTELVAGAGAERRIAPERGLFRHIILNAILHAIYGSSWEPHKNHLVKAEAWGWFVDAGPDFEMICECAGMNPEVVRRKALAFIMQQREVRDRSTRPTLHHAISSSKREMRIAA